VEITKLHEAMTRNSTTLSGWILPLTLGAIAGAFSAIVMLSWLGDLTPNGVSYSDLAAVLLTASGLIVTCRGVAFALAAFGGCGELRRSSIAAAEVAAVAEIKEQIENGKVRDYIEDALESEILSPRMERRILSRVDEIVMGNPRRDAELDYDGGEGES
jgi:hypothetical protein